MAPKEFEHALAFLCVRDGCTGVQVVGGAGDLGADVIAFAPDGRKIVLQAKRYGSASKVGGPALQRFGGTCFNVHQAHIAAVVTTSVFTKQAWQYAAHMGIRLFDQHGLAAWATRTGPAPWH
ncbi:MAG TPA: restriction endonuclease [Pseudonocardiaceae bacterium]|nr:restriction endonuclease [Pseudonocardiaceae bacterium]